MPNWHQIGIYLENDSVTIRRQDIIKTNAKLDSWHMYVSIGRNEFVEDNDYKYLYFVNVENTDMRETQWYKTRGHCQVCV